MKSRTLCYSILCLATAACVWLNGCGGGNANAVTVSVSSSVGTSIILTQSTTLTATISGGTAGGSALVNWQPCQFTTTSSTGTVSAKQTCPSSNVLGTLSNQQATGTATYTAPATIPDQTTYPGLAIIISAQSQQDTSKTGSITLTLNSGIGVLLTPSTATVPVNEQQSFSVALANDLQNKGVTFLLTQQIPTSTTTYPGLTTCSPGCGTILSSTATTFIYKAPATVPTATTPSGASTTPASVTVVATAKTDNTRFALGSITIVNGGPITFNGISPSVAPQGAAYWDIYLDAPNISSASVITITGPSGPIAYSSVSTCTNTQSPFYLRSQTKVLFPIPTATTTSPASTGARLRLCETDLAATGTYTVSVSDPVGVTQAAGGNFTFTILPVRPSMIATAPTGVIQNSPSVNNFSLSMDGGYFGSGGNLANVTFLNSAGIGVPIPKDTSSASVVQDSRQLNLQFPTSAIDAPGLFPIEVSRSAPPVPNPNNPSVTTLSIFPDYNTSPVPSVTTSIAAGTSPSAIDIDPILGVAAVVETGSNAVQFYTISPGALTPLGAPVAVGNHPTSISVNRANHSVAVVNYGSSSVTVLPIPGAPAPVSPFTIDLSGLISGNAPAPLPYSIGVDPDTNLALIAFSSTAAASANNVGYVLNLNQGNNPYGCPYAQLANVPALSITSPCVYAQVTLNTGQYPQVAMAPHGHLAYVTPGNNSVSSVIRGVSLTNTSSENDITSVTFASGIVTVTVDVSKHAFALIPGTAGSVQILGVPVIGSTNVNGVYTVSVTSSTTFQYALTPVKSSDTGTVSGGHVFYGAANLIFSATATTQGIAINSITHTAAMTDPSASAGQILLLNQLDQSTGSITLNSGCTIFTSSCSGSPEVTTAAVAWQPYDNSIVTYNPVLNQVSVSEPVTQERYALVSLLPTTTNQEVQINVPNSTSTPPLTLTLYGAVAVDPATNQAFAVQPASGMIEVVNLGPGTTNKLKPVEITELVVPGSGLGVIGGIPNALFPQGTLTSASSLSNVQIYGSGFLAGAVVRLDGTPLPGANVTLVSSRQLSVTIPASFLSMPHRYALDVISNSKQSNPTDFVVVKSVTMAGVCATPNPSSVTIADELREGPFSPIAVVSNAGCNSISTIDINPQNTNTFGTVLNTIAVGSTPLGVAVSQHLGYAVVANNGSGSASIIDLTTFKKAVADVGTGVNPLGVAINDSTGAAIVVNNGDNTISEINLALLSGSSPATSLTAITIGGVQQPFSVAIDPDRGTNNQGLAIVSGLELQNGASPVGALFPVDIGSTTPSLSTAVALASVNAAPTDIVFTPAVATTSGNPGLFFATASGGNLISSYNPDLPATSATSTVNVGVNPTALAINPQTGALLTSNVGEQSVSVVDTLSNPFKTQQTYGLPGSGQFSVVIDQFTNFALVVDQANNRVLIFEVPN